MIRQEIKKEDYPILFQEEHIRSEKYKHISSIDIVTQIEETGWRPVSVKQQNSKKYAGYQPHIILFENDDLTENFKRDGIAPTLYVQNSFNGLKSFSIHFGFFRMVCLNGLVLGESVIPEMKLRHKGITDNSNIHEIVDYYVDGIPNACESIERMRESQIGRIDQVNLAGQLLEYRYPQNNGKFPIRAEEMLIARRKEDDSNTVWDTFNRIQENMMKGGQEIDFPEGKKRKTKTRALTEINREILLNKALWNMAMGYCR